jgi:hypothetical protein
MAIMHAQHSAHAVSLAQFQCHDAACGQHNQQLTRWAESGRETECTPDNRQNHREQHEAAVVRHCAELNQGVSLGIKRRVGKPC